jgi:hypothetical protein
MAFAAELQQGVAILRKGRRLPAYFRYDTGVVEYRIPHEVARPPIFPARPASAWIIFDEGCSKLGTYTGPRFP